MVAQLDRLLSIKSHESLITWSCKIMWQTKTIILSTLPQSLWPPNLEVTLPWGAPNHKVTQRSHHAVFWKWHEKQTFISANWVPLMIKLDRIPYLSGLLPIKSHGPFWSRGLVRSCNKIKPLYLNYHSAYGYRTR